MDDRGRKLVAGNRTTTAILLLQFFAVLMVCFNHLSISLLKGSPAFFSEAVYAVPARFGLVFLVASSGFLTHFFFTQQWGGREADSRLGYVVSRYWRLALPVLAALAFDYFIQGFADFRQTRDVERALPFLLTLTQTWHYHVLGATSLAEPAGGSNMAWLSANLFFLVVFYGLTAKLWNKLRSTRILCGILVACALAYLAYFSLLKLYTPEITAWAEDRYGADLAPAYVLWSWLFQYGPYVHIPVFISGVVVARLVQIASPVVLGRVLLGSFLFALLAHNHAAYLGWSCFAIVFTVRWAASLNECSPWFHRLSPSGFLARLGASAYEVYVLHLLVYLAFTLSTMPGMGAYNLLMLLGRVAVVNMLTILLCVGFAEYYFAPWQAWLTERCGFRSGHEVRHV